MIERLRIAAASVASRPGDTKGNLGRIEAVCGQAARQGAQLVLTPELSLTGFVPNHPAGDHAAWLREALAGARRIAERLDGGALDGLASVAARTGVMIAAGLLEDAGNLLFNSTVLVDAGGVLGVFRKMHVPMFEMPFYNGGPAPEVAATNLGRIGVNICFDALLPESTRLLAVQNAELVLFPFAADPPPGTAAAWADWAGPALRARCRENGVFGVAVNYQGTVRFAGVEQTFPGGALVVGPKGEGIASEVEGGSLLIADLEAAALAAARSEPEYLFRFRRPELYGPLAR